MRIFFAIIVASFEVSLWVYLSKTVIPLTLVGYEIVITNLALRASLAIYHLISNTPSWNNC